jgi:hypothetical protein
MVSAVQSVPSNYTVTPLVSQGIISQLALRAKSLLAVPSTIVTLGVIPPMVLTYNAQGMPDNASSLSTAAASAMIGSIASFATSSASTPTSISNLAALLSSGTTGTNTDTLNSALGEYLAGQLANDANSTLTGLTSYDSVQALNNLLNSNSSSVDLTENSNTTKFVAATSPEIDANNVKVLDSLFATKIDLTSTSSLGSSIKEQVLDTNANSSTTLTKVSPETATSESVTPSNTTLTSATTTPIISNSVAATNAANTTETSVVSNNLNASTVVDSGNQAMATIAGNPAYANLVAGLYVSVAASYSPPTNVVTKPSNLEEIKPVIAIPVVGELTQYTGHFWHNIKNRWFS